MLVNTRCDRRDMVRKGLKLGHEEDKKVGGGFAALSDQRLTVQSFYLVHMKEAHYHRRNSHGSHVGVFFVDNIRRYDNG